MNREQRCDNLDRLIESHNLLRGSWGDGYRRACLLSAMAPEIIAHGMTAYGSPVTRIDLAACPASLMPDWMAHITPAIDDWGSDSLWGVTIRRYADLARRWHVLDDAAWERVRVRLDDALPNLPAWMSMEAYGGMVAQYEVRWDYGRTLTLEPSKSYSDRIIDLVLNSLHGEILAAEHRGIPIEDAMPPRGIPIEDVLEVKVELAR